jgi:hypothetical protein
MPAPSVSASEDTDLYEQILELPTPRNEFRA